MIEIRAVNSNMPEFADAVKLQKAIWGFDDVDLLPVRLFVTASKIGGQPSERTTATAWSDFAWRFPASSRRRKVICTATCWGDEGHIATPGWGGS